MWKNFMKSSLQLLKANMDQQQKFEERQKLVLRLHKQQLKFQHLTLQKTELQQKHFDELHVNSLNGSKFWKRHDIFPIYNSIETFEYIPEKDKTFEAFYSRYEHIFNVDWTMA